MGKPVLASIAFGTNHLSLASILASSASSSKKRKRARPRSGPLLQALLKRRLNNKKRKRRRRLHLKRSRKRKRRRYSALPCCGLIVGANCAQFRPPVLKQRSKRLQLQMLQRRLGGSSAPQTRVGMQHD